MRSIAWLVIGVVGFVLAYSTRADQSYSHLRLIGCVLLAIGSVGLLPGEGDDMTVDATAFEELP
jgi:hypothetical protein